MTEINDGVATIEDIDKSGTPTSVPAAQPPAGDAPASNPAASAPATQAETPAVPSQEGPADASAPSEPKKFQESTEYRRIQRQRANAERRALRAEAELAALRSNPQQPAPQARASEQPKASDFANYDDYVRHQAAEAAKAAAREVVAESRKAQAQDDAAGAAKQAKQSFEREAAKQAEAAGIDFEEAWETLLELPPEDVSDAFAVYLYQAAENKAALVDHFAKNPDEVARISRLHPAAAFKELAKADLQMGVKPKPPATKAPPIGPTVGGRGVAQKTETDMDMKEFATHFMAKEEARLKRM